MGHVLLQLIESLWCEVKPDKTECTSHQVDKDVYLMMEVLHVLET